MEGVRTNAILAVAFACMVITAKSALLQDWQGECNNEHEHGRKCVVSGWVCHGRYEKLTKTITYKNGRWNSQWSTRYPCTLANPCKRDKDESVPNVPDKNAPLCRSDGYYKKKQCYLFPGAERCWCVNWKTGVEVPGSSRFTEAERNNLTCGKGVALPEKSGIMQEWLNDCVKERKIGRGCEVSGWVCQGTYEKLEKVLTYKNGARRIFWKTRVPCTSAKPCNAEVDKIDPDVHDVFKPDCRTDGYYQAKQCYDAEGKHSCWCVNWRTGVELVGTRKWGNDLKQVTCGTECADNHKDCAYWKGTGECNRNPAYMHWYCKRSCGLCK